MRTHLISFAFALTACSSASMPNLPAADMADPCAPYGRTENGACVSQVDFNAGPSLPHARDHHGTAIWDDGTNAFLYVTGGTNYAGVFHDANVAPIQADGTLGAFTATTPMPVVRAGHGTVTHAGRLFVIGGQANGNFLSTVSSAPINADGTLGTWEDEPALPDARFHIGVIATDTHVYAIGGVTNPGQLPFIAQTNVWYAAWQSDGHLGPWQTAMDLPAPRSHHSVLVHDGTIYVVGGLIKDTSDGGPMATDVLVSKLGSDGTPGPFTVGGTFDEPTGTGSTFELQGFLYAVGGLTEDDSYSGRVRRAPFQADGTLGAFTDVAMLPTPRSHVHQTPFYRGYMYTMGGSIDYQVVTDEVWVGAFTPPADGAPLQMQSYGLKKATRHGDASCPCAKSERISIPK